MKMKYKVDPLVKEAIKNILWGTIFSVSALLSSGLINWIINILSIRDLWLIDWFPNLSTIASISIWALFMIKSFIEMIRLIFKPIKWKGKKQKSNTK